MSEEHIGLKQCLITKPKGVPYYSSKHNIEHLRFEIMIMDYVCVCI